MLLTLLALAVPLPALAISESDSVAQPGPAAISVSAALDSCGVLDGGIVCKINVAYSQIPGATSYSATVTAANGSVTDYGTVGANATTLYVPYAGDGGYRIRITAYGTPEHATEDSDDQGEVIASGVSRPGTEEGAPRTRRNVKSIQRRRVAMARLQSQPIATPAPTCEAASAPEPAPTSEPEPLPEQPPEDLDAENPDEDADGVLDADEQAAYDAAVAAQLAAVEPAVADPAPAAC